MSEIFYSLPERAWGFFLAAGIRFFLGTALGQAPAPSLSADEQLPTLTQASQIHQLLPEQCSRGYPVHLEGVVLYHNHLKTLFIHDLTEGIYVVENPSSEDSLQSGQRVAVRGVTGPGDFAPVVRARRIEGLGMAPMPPAREVSFEQLATGREDCHWVQLRGIVRSVRVNPTTGLPEFQIAAGGGEVRTEIFEKSAGDLSRFVDATVRVRGAVGGTFNQKRQLVAAKLFVPGLTNVLVEEPAPPDPFAVPIWPINTLLRYSAQGAYGHRIKVRGRVTFHQPGRTLFIRDESQALSTQTQQGPELSPGDEVEVIGFAALGEWMPVLRDAVFRKTGSGSPPHQIAVSAARALEGEFDTDLVQIEARLLERVRRPGAEVLVMQADNLIFNAMLEATGNPLAHLRDGSQLRLSGICLVQVSGPAKQRHAFQILLRSPKDIVVLSNPPWWTMARILWVLGIITAVLLLAMAWVFILRRRVRVQTEIIRQKVQQEAVLEERTRIAREFHDTLEQELAGMGLQLNAVELQLMDRPQEALQDLRLAQQMIRRSLVEAQRSVWDLRSRGLGNGDLMSALEEVAKSFNGKGLNLSVRNVGRARRLPGVIENHLLRIGQEAIANAVRHACARNLEIKIRYRTDCVALYIHDDGNGFQIETAPSPEQGHFGLLGMRERAEKLRGKFSIQSRPGLGTEILVEIPLSGAENKVQTNGWS